PAQADRLELVDQRLARAREVEQVHAPVGRMIAADHQPLLLEPVDDVSDRGEGDAEGLGDIAHVRAGGLGETEEHLRLGGGEREGRRLLPEELAEDRAAERVQELQHVPGLARRRPLAARSDTVVGIHVIQLIVYAIKGSAGKPVNGSGPAAQYPRRRSTTWRSGRPARVRGRVSLNKGVR